MSARPLVTRGVTPSAGRVAPAKGGPRGIGGSRARMGSVPPAASGDHPERRGVGYPRVYSVHEDRQGSSRRQQQRGSIPRELEARGYAAGTPVLIEELEGGELRITPTEQLRERIRTIGERVVADHPEALRIVAEHDPDSAHTTVERRCKTRKARARRFEPVDALGLRAAIIGGTPAQAADQLRDQGGLEGALGRPLSYPTTRTPISRCRAPSWRTASPRARRCARARSGGRSGSSPERSSEKPAAVVRSRPFRGLGAAAWSHASPRTRATPRVA